MDKYLGVAWLFATSISWISFGVASWFWAEDPEPGMLVLTILWFLISLVLFWVGWKFREHKNK